MTFKAHWEKTQSTFQLNDHIIRAMIRDAFPKNDIKETHLISGGCANLNVSFTLNGLNMPFILRVYARDDKAIAIEKAIGEQLKDSIPCPELCHTGSIDGHRFSIATRLPGITLRDYLLNSTSPIDYTIMKEVGDMLGTLSQTRYSNPGFFDETLTPIANSQPPLSSFCLTALHHPNTQYALTDQTSKTIDAFITEHSDLLDHNEESCLVHGDFDPANMLVNSSNGKMHVSGILDWEFAFSGSPLWDVSNMLRYRHQLDPAYQSYFLKGFSSAYSLPEDWEKRIDLYNLASLLDCLMRYDPRERPIRMGDICELTSRIIQAPST